MYHILKISDPFLLQSDTDRCSSKVDLPQVENLSGSEPSSFQGRLELVWWIMIHIGLLEC